MMADVDHIRIYATIFSVLVGPKVNILNVATTKLPQVECKYSKYYLK